MSEKHTYIIIALSIATLLVLLGFIGWIFFGPGENLNGNPQSDNTGQSTSTVTIEKELSNKIVYSLANDEVDPSSLMADCADRGGTFNDCGSYCEEDEICIQACAYTCEFE